MSPESAAQEHPAQEPRPYDLSRPVVRAESRRALEDLHQELAVEWSRVLCEHTEPPETLMFEGLSMERCAQLGEAGPVARVAAFALEGTSVSGVISLSADLARHLVDAKFGPPSSPSADATSFSRLEAGVLRHTLDQLSERLAVCYGRAGISRLQVTKVAERLEELRLFAPDDYVLVFRFRVGEPGSSLRLSVVAGLDLINLAQERNISRRMRASERVARAVREVPIDVRVILGGWRVPLREAAALKRGDSIVLPDGADAWLEANGRRIGGIVVGIDRNRVILTANRSRVSVRG